MPAKESPKKQIAVSPHNVTVFTRQTSASKKDVIAVEEPLEIRIGIWKKQPHPKRYYLTMRTPGDDQFLATGFLFSEGIIQKQSDILEITHCTDPQEEQHFNVMNVMLMDHVHLSEKHLKRNVNSHSGCGVCGKTTLAEIKQKIPEIPQGTTIYSADLFYKLLPKLMNTQQLFTCTGGLHAAALFNSNGNLISLFEDVGRHNALDKLIGDLLQKDKIPASGTVLLLSGRASFELLQKAACAGIPVVASVGAPSSLAVQVAKEFQITLIGFLKEDRFNVYSGEERIKINL